MRSGCLKSTVTPRANIPWRRSGKPCMTKRLLDTASSVTSISAIMTADTSSSSLRPDPGKASDSSYRHSLAAGNSPSSSTISNQKTGASQQATASGWARKSSSSSPRLQTARQPAGILSMKSPSAQPAKSQRPRTSPTSSQIMKARRTRTTGLPTPAMSSPSSFCISNMLTTPIRSIIRSGRTSIP